MKSYRPFGVAILFAGIDEKGPQLFHMDPSGTYVQYDAKAIGSGSEGAQQSLQEMYHKVNNNSIILIPVHKVVVVYDIERGTEKCLNHLETSHGGKAEFCQC